MARHYADYEHITWGAMGNPPLTYDCIDEWLHAGAQGDVGEGHRGPQAGAGDGAGPTSAPASTT